MTSFLVFQALGSVHYNGQRGELIAASSQESPPIIQSSHVIKMRGGKVCYADCRPTVNLGDVGLRGDSQHLFVSMRENRYQYPIISSKNHVVAALFFLKIKAREKCVSKA